MDINILTTLKSSFVMMLLLGCSLIAVTFVIERWLYLKRSAINADIFFTQIREALQRGGLDAAVSICNTSFSAMSAVVRAGLEHSPGGPKATEEIMEAVAMEERARLEKNLNVLGTLGNIAPLIGLFGTVLGIIHAFHAMAMNGTAGPSIISAGIAEALLTTAAGLVVAVPAVVFYNHYVRLVANIMTDIEAVGKRLSLLLHGSRPNVMQVLPQNNHVKINTVPA